MSPAPSFGFPGSCYFCNLLAILHSCIALKLNIRLRPQILGMKNLVLSLFFLSAFILIAQESNQALEIQVLKETLPQVLDNNPNSIAFYLKGGKFYNLSMEIAVSGSKMDPSIDTNQWRADLDKLSDSIYEVLENNKIKVSLSNTLYAYNYKPSKVKYIDGRTDITDLRETESWEYEKEFLIERFQGDYEHYGFEQPIDLEFIYLIHLQLNQNAKNQHINLSALNNSYYEFCSKKEVQKDTTSGRTINAVCIYKPVFNQNEDKACYLFTFQAANGPFREFVFVEKKNEKWYLVETYGTHHIDGDRDYVK